MVVRRLCGGAPVFCPLQNFEALTQKTARPIHGELHYASHEPLFAKFGSVFEKINCFAAWDSWAPRPHRCWSRHIFYDIYNSTTQKLKIRLDQYMGNNLGFKMRYCTAWFLIFCGWGDQLFLLCALR